LKIVVVSTQPQEIKSKNWTTLWSWNLSATKKGC